MFRGLSAINLDSKGRMAVPARYRDCLLEQVAGEIVVTIDTHFPCLLLYPMTEWETIEAKLENLPSFDPAARRIQRLLIGHATEMTMDNNGRILLPPLLREYANLDKRIMFVGQGKKFELWSETNWDNGRAQWLDEESSGTHEVPDALRSLSL